jgi:predicted Zn-dependent protease
MTDPVVQMADAAEMLWVVLANVSGGDWTQQSAEWQEAAARWRDAYFAAVKAASVPPAPPAPDQAERAEAPIA